jgi:hypothetical protein
VVQKPASVRARQSHAENRATAADHSGRSRHAGLPTQRRSALAALARTRKKSPPVEIVHLPGINHLLAPAKTGDVAEYATLPDKNITPAVAKTIGDWLKK